MFLSICKSFFAKQENTFQSHMKKEEIILSGKIKWMLHKSKKIIYNDIFPMHYHVPNNQSHQICTVVSDFQDAQYQLSVHRNNSCRFNNYFNIKIELIEFIETISMSSLLNIKEGWFTNLSGL